MATNRTGRDLAAPHIYRDDDLRSNVVQIATEPCDLYGWNIINPNSYSVYVKFYDTVDTVTVGTTTVVKTLLVPSMSTVVYGSSTIRGNSQFVFNRGIQMAVTTGMADSSTSAPILSVYTEIFYR